VPSGSAATCWKTIRRDMSVTSYIRNLRDRLPAFIPDAP
jgi:hypothetical protein